MKAPVWAGLALSLALRDPAAALDAAAPITEAAAVRTFLEESPQARLVRARAEATRAGFRVGTEVANPAVAYQVEDAAGVRDEFLTFEQELPITGRRSLLQERGEAASSAAALLAEHELRSATADLRTAFYEVLFRDTEVRLLEQGVTMLDGTVEVLRERERAGEGSGYDVVRAEQEAAELQLAIVGANAAARTARARFAAFFDPSRPTGAATFEGDFALTGHAWTAEEAVAKALVERSDLLALRQKARQQELDLKAAERQRFPEPFLTAGWKKVEALGQSDTGYVAALMVPLPLFQRGQHAAASARAASAQVNLETAIREREIRAEVEAALARAEAARQAAERFGEATVRRAAELRRIAQSAYDEGEQGILELLDALRTSLRMELLALESRHEARREQIALERAMGSEVRP